jgi:hypothetical protein
MRERDNHYHNHYDSCASCNDNNYRWSDHYYYGNQYNRCPLSIRKTYLQA